MVIEALRIGRVGLFQRVAERSTPIIPEFKIREITQFTRNEALDIARAYINNKLALVRPFSSVEKARLEGTTEVQKKTLELIGQYHLVKIYPATDMRNARPIDEADLARDLRPVDMSGIKKLTNIYLESKSYATSHKLESKEWNQLLPEEVGMYARMSESGKLLTALGQGDLIIDINKEFDSPSEHVNWEKMRSTGHGELQ